MLSAPPPIAMSASPSMIDCAAETIACSPLPHRRFTVRPASPCCTPPFRRRHAREVHVLRLGVDHVAEDDVADLPAVDTRALERFGDHDGAELGGWHVLQTPAETSRWRCGPR